MKLHIICIREDFFQKSPNCFATIPYANLRPIGLANPIFDGTATFNEVKDKMCADNSIKMLPLTEVKGNLKN